MDAIALPAAFDWRDWLLVALVPVFVLAFLVEWRVMHRAGRATRFRGDSIRANLGLGIVYMLFESVAKLVITVPVALWVHSHRVFDIPVNAWTALPIFFAVEFLYYWFHRGSHRVRWFWCAHVVHHSGEDMNMTTAMRQGVLYTLTGWWLFFLPLVWLGVHPAWVFFFYACDLAYQYFVHTESVGRLHPWIEYVFNTPSHHRAHHGRNGCYIDRNFGGVFIVFDRWFGTFAAEDEAVEYGIPTPPATRSLLMLNLHEFIAMWRDVARTGRLRDRLKHVWGPPEWRRPS